MIIFENLVEEFRKLNSTLEQIQEQNKRSNDYLDEMAFEIKNIAKNVLSLENTFDIGRVITFEQHIESIRESVRRSLIEIEVQLQSIQVERNKTSFQNVRELECINEKLSSVVDYIDSKSFYESDDNDVKKNITNVQLAMMIQSLKQIEKSVTEK